MMKDGKQMKNGNQPDAMDQPALITATTRRLPSRPMALRLVPTHKPTNSDLPVRNRRLLGSIPHYWCGIPCLPFTEGFQIRADGVSSAHPYISGGLAEHGSHTI